MEQSSFIYRCCPLDGTCRMFSWLLSNHKISQKTLILVWRWKDRQQESSRRSWSLKQRWALLYLPLVKHKRFSVYVKDNTLLTGGHFEGATREERKWGKRHPDVFTFKHLIFSFGRQRRDLAKQRNMKRWGIKTWYFLKNMVNIYLILNSFWLQRSVK